VHPHPRECTDPAAAEEQYGSISKWDVSHVTNMDWLFISEEAFNEDIKAWDVSSVTTMDWTITDERTYALRGDGATTVKISHIKAADLDREDLENLLLYEYALQQSKF
jgi:hypothetical protein